MKRLSSAFSYRNSIILITSILILFFLVFSGLPSSSNPVISTTAVEASAEPSATAKPGSIRRALAATSAAPFFAPSITATKVDAISIDVDSDLKADPGDELMYTVTITNGGPDPATAVMFTDTIDPNTTLVPGSIAASPIAVNDSYNTIGNVNIQVPAPGVRANDLNPNVVPSTTITALEVTQVNATAVPSGGSATVTTTNNGSVTLSSDGSFTYTPDDGFRGPTDTFTYTLGNGTGKTDTATVTINIAGLIWFVNNDPGAPGAAPGDGRLNNPFRQLAGASSFDTLATDQTGDVIFIYTGTANYTGGLTLLATQKIIGQGAPTSILAITGFTAPSGNKLLPATNGTDPVIVTSGTTAITLGQNNELHGFTVGNTGAAGTDIAGTTFGTTPGLTVRDVTLNGSGQALNLMTGTIVSGSTFQPAVARHKAYV
jgi:trimeric autotransporter adhesin